MPLVLSSLITGVASLSDLKKLSRIGGRTISIYIATTTIAVTIGLLSVNVLQPGSTVPDEMKTKLQDTYQSSVSGRVQAAEQVKERSALQPIVDMVPSNFFNAASNNRNMLQVVFVAIIVGIALIQIKKEKARPVLEFFEGINELVIKLVENIMLIAPYGVFALIADTITSIAGNNINNVLELLGALAFYMFAVIIGLLIQTLFTYSLVLKIFSKIPQDLTEKAENLLNFVGLYQKRKLRAGDLSFGQQKLLELAMALMNEPEMLLLDEPTAGINPTLINGIIDRLIKVNQDFGITLLVIEHNMRVIMQLAESIYCLAHGKMLANGTPDEIKNDKRVIDAYLGAQ